MRSSFAAIVDPVAARVQVAKAPLRPRAAPSASARHGADLPERARQYHPPPMDTRTIVVLEGDETGQELLEEGLRTLAPDVIGLELDVPALRPLAREPARDRERRRVRGRRARSASTGSASRPRRSRPRGRDDVGSPNRILREEIGGRVIVRTGRRIPGVVPLGGVHAPISVVRMAVGDAYGAKEWREGEGDDEVAFRTERIERRICRAVAEFAFRQAERMGAKVFGGPKYTVSPTYEGMLKEEMDAAAERHPDVPYEPQLIDATFALLLAQTGAPLVIPALNRDGDILSDLVLPLFGSIAGSESLLVAFDDDYVPRRADGRGRARHGARALREGRRQSDGDDPRRRRAARARGRAGAAGGARDPRGVPRGGGRGHPHRRSRRARGHARVHRRGDPAHDARSSRSGPRSSARRETAAAIAGLAIVARAATALDERLGELRIELAFRRTAPTSASACLDRQRRAVRRALDDHRVEGVRDGRGGAPRAGSRTPARPVGIAAPVPALVVEKHVRQAPAGSRSTARDQARALRPDGVRICASSCGRRARRACDSTLRGRRPACRRRGATPPSRSCLELLHRASRAAARGASAIDGDPRRVAPQIWVPGLERG